MGPQSTRLNEYIGVQACQQGPQGVAGMVLRRLDQKFVSVALVTLVAASTSFAQSARWAGALESTQYQTGTGHRGFKPQLSPESIHYMPEEIALNFRYTHLSALNLQNAPTEREAYLRIKPVKIESLKIGDCVQTVTDNTLYVVGKAPRRSFAHYVGGKGLDELIDVATDLAISSGTKLRVIGIADGLVEVAHFANGLKATGDFFLTSKDVSAILEVEPTRESFLRVACRPDQSDIPPESLFLNFRPWLLSVRRSILPSEVQSVLPKLTAPSFEDIAPDNRHPIENLIVSPISVREIEERLYFKKTDHQVCTLALPLNPSNKNQILYAGGPGEFRQYDKRILPRHQNSVLHYEVLCPRENN